MWALAFALALTSLGCGPPRPSVVWLGGDVQVSQPRADRLAALATIEGQGVVNLEGPVGPVTRPISATHLVNDARVPGLLAAAGVAVVGLANNHRDDLGAAGVHESVRRLKSAGLIVADQGRPAHLGSPAGGVSIVVGEVSDLAAMRADLRRPASLRVASLHVLAPPSYLPSPQTRRAVDALLAAGADVVAVHGSHALGPVERRRGKIIAWGLGNLAFDCACTREDEAMLLRVWRSGDAIEGVVVPIEAGLAGEPVRRHPDAAGIIALLQGLGSDVDVRGRVRGRSAVAEHAGAQADAE